jgi:hypothetical protein
MAGLAPNGKPRGIMLNLSGEHDETIAARMSITVRELVHQRRETVRKVREDMGDSLNGFDDDEVYALLLQAEERLQEIEKNALPPRQNL